MQPIEYNFPDDPEQRSYRIFPPELETDEHVFFHGTAAGNLQSIIEAGFQFPPPPKAQSVSFASSSALALRYGCSPLNGDIGNGCIIAVRYADLTRLAAEGFGVYDYRLDPQPTIVGYCNIPSTYRHA